ncbi:MAG: hypothetical protein AB1796_15350 [Bacillota bacterium]
MVELVTTHKYVLAAVKDEGEGFNWRERIDKAVLNYQIIPGSVESVVQIVEELL